MGRNEFHFHLIGVKVSVKGSSGQAAMQGALGSGAWAREVDLGVLKQS